jgi:hypothetical protein
VTAGYFEMFGIALLQGGAFLDADRAETPAVVVVSESFARMLWPGEEAVGQRVRISGEALATVVGVARDIKYHSLAEEGAPLLYLPLSQAYSDQMVLQVRLAGDTPGARMAVRLAVQELDPALPLPVMTSMDNDIAISLLPTRVGAGVLAGFGAMALLLAIIGVYGVTAFLVGERTREIGVRSALGATAGQVVHLMMVDTLRLAATGVAIGLAAGIGVGALISGWLYGVGAFDPRPLGGAGLVLLVGVALVGTWLPARRALRVDPVTALRAD